MKPGNLQCKVPNPAATTDEDSIERTSSLRCVHFYLADSLECHCEERSDVAIRLLSACLCAKTYG